jgi:hypothetical protein
MSFLTNPARTVAVSTGPSPVRRMSQPLDFPGAQQNSGARAHSSVLTLTPQHICIVHLLPMRVLLRQRQGNYLVIDTPVNSVLSYHYVANVVHWETAVALCPHIGAGYFSLARFYNNYEWNVRRSPELAHAQAHAWPSSSCPRTQRTDSSTEVLLRSRSPVCPAPPWPPLHSFSRKPSIAASNTAASTRPTPTRRTSRACGSASPRLRPYAAPH